MTEENVEPDSDAQSRRALDRSSESIEWYSVGQGRTVEVNGVRVSVRLVRREGRRARIAIEAPPGAVFRST